MKKFLVYYHSRYYKFDRHSRYVRAASKKQIREEWFGMMCTDEYVIEKIVEVKE